MALGLRRVRSNNNTVLDQHYHHVESPSDADQRIAQTITAQLTQSTQGGTMSKKKGRGKSVNIALQKAFGNNGDRPLPIEILPELFKPVTGLCKEWTTEIGLVGRRELSPSISRWKDLSEVDKEKIYNLISRKFVNPNMKEPIDKKLMGILRDFRHRMKVHYYRMKKKHGNPRLHPFDSVDEERWLVICDRFELEAWQRRSEINSTNRRKREINHFGGSKPFVRYRHELLTEQDPEHTEPSSINIEVYKMMHYKEGKGWVHPEAEELHGKMISLSQVPPSKGGPSNGNEAFRVILGEKNGYERGLGYGAKPTQSRLSTRAEVEAANKRANDA